MKALRVIGNIIIGIILFSLIFTLLFVTKTRDLIESDVLKETIKNVIDDIENNDNDLTESQKKVIDDMFKDSELSSMISMILKNYKEYINNPNYMVSQEDANKLHDFVKYYKNNIKDLSGENVSKMSDEEFDNYFNIEKIDEFAKNAFKEFDKNIEKKDISIAIDAYSFATSKSIRLVLSFIIVFFIGLLILINWSPIKWMLVVGIDLIVSGVLFFMLYVSVEMIKDMFLKENAKINFNVNSFFLSSILQLIIGILLIVIYMVIKNKLNGKKQELVTE